MAYQPTAYENRIAVRYFVRTGITIAVALLMLQANPSFGAAVIVMTLTAALTLHPRVFIHEWGHAFAARKVGAEVWRIEIGSGPLRRRLQFNGFTFNIHDYAFMGGSTWHASIEGKALRKRTAAILVGGALANFLAALLALFLAYALFVLNPALLPLTVIVSGFALASITMALFSLIPQTYVSPNPTPSDGRRLLDLFRHDPAQPTNNVELIALQLAFARRYDELIQTLEDNWQGSKIRLLLASLLIDALSRVRGNQAVMDFYAIHSDQLSIPGEAEDDSATAWTLGNVAWSAIKFGRLDLNDLAESLSAKAMEKAPDAAPIQATRAAWLIMAGETQAGTDLLTKAIRALDSVNDKGEFCRCLAHGLHTLGAHEKAKT
jgi:Zn-dependent protease